MPLNIDQLDSLLADQEKAVRDAFAAFVSQVRSDHVMAEVVAKLEARDVPGALAIVQSYIGQMANVLPIVASNVGVATAAEFAAALPTIAPGVGIGFDPSFPRAAELIRASRLRFVRDFTEQQEKATVQAISRAFTDGRGTIATARAFRDSIGLTPYQEGWVASYRAQLESKSKMAAQRQLRDRRKDGMVTRQATGGRSMTEQQIDRAVESYRANAVAMRAETIARTEGVRAMSQAREESLRQMITQTGIAAERVKRIWNPTGDKRTRDWHASMKGQEQAMDVAFKDGLGNLLLYPGDPSAPPETTINCRCVLTFRIVPAA